MNLIEKIIERIKTKPGYKVLAAFGIIAGLIHLINVDNAEYIKKLQNSTVICNIKGQGLTEINSSKIIGYDDETGIIIFDNGYAKNCIIEK